MVGSGDPLVVLEAPGSRANRVDRNHPLTGECEGPAGLQEGPPPREGPPPIPAPKPSTEQSRPGGPPVLPPGFYLLKMAQPIINLIPRVSAE